MLFLNQIYDTDRDSVLGNGKKPARGSHTVYVPAF